MPYIFDCPSTSQPPMTAIADAIAGVNYPSPTPTIAFSDDGADSSQSSLTAPSLTQAAALNHPAVQEALCERDREIQGLKGEIERLKIAYEDAKFISDMITEYVRQDEGE